MYYSNLMLVWLAGVAGAVQEDHNTPWPVEKSMAAEAQAITDALIYRINRAAGPYATAMVWQHSLLVVCHSLLFGTTAVGSIG